jgi:hypothetical protein
MQRFKGIVALLMLALMMPLHRACAAISTGGTVQHACCQPHHADPCCKGSANLCGVAQVPANTVVYSAAGVSLAVLPVVSSAVVWPHRNKSMQSRSVTLPWPAQHSPPGLVIAATTVLRI